VENLETRKLRFVNGKLIFCEERSTNDRMRHEEGDRGEPRNQSCAGRTLYCRLSRENKLFHTFSTIKNEVLRIE
jgi:hypothetical protein